MIFTLNCGVICLLRFKQLLFANLCQSVLCFLRGSFKNYYYYSHRFPYMVDLVGDFGCGLVIPGDEGAVSRVSAHTVRACYEVHTTSQKQDVQGLLDPCFVHLHHLKTNT